jgi:hypothetical protein
MSPPSIEVCKVSTRPSLWQQDCEIHVIMHGKFYFLSRGLPDYKFFFVNNFGMGFVLEYFSFYVSLFPFFVFSMF